MHAMIGGIETHLAVTEIQEEMIREEMIEMIEIKKKNRKVIGFAMRYATANLFLQSN